MRLPHTLALLRRPRRAAARTAAVAQPGQAAAPRVRPPRIEAAVPVAALVEAPYIDLAQRVREVGEW